MFKQFLIDLKREFLGYNGKKLASDLMAGVTVAAVALPLALAFGVSSGADAAAGLITAIIGGLIIGALSGGYYQISGPTGAMAAILIPIVAKYSMKGVFIVTFMAGIILLLAGILKLGTLTNFIPMPVITGFTSGIAVIIAMGQIDNFFGVKSNGENIIQKIMSYKELGFSPNLSAVMLALFVVLFMIFFPKKWNAVVPASLLGIVFATIISISLGLNVETVGAIPKTLILENRLTLSSIKLSEIINFISPAISIAMLGMIESLLCGASAGRMTGENLNANQELVAQGVGNIILPFVGGIPATAAIARTSVAIKSGAKTRLTGIFHAIGLLIFMLVLAPVMSNIPMCALAGVLMVTAFRMNEWHVIKYIINGKFKSSILMFLSTMIATIVFDLTIAILIGVGIALIHMTGKLSHLSISYAKVELDRVEIENKIMEKHYRRAMVAYISGPIVFANAQKVENTDENFEGCDKVFLSMRGVSDIDITGAQSMISLIHSLKDRNSDVIVCGLSDKARKMFDRSGLTSLIGEENIFWSIDRAILSDHSENFVAVNQKVSN